MDKEKILLSKSDYDKKTIVSLGVDRTFSLFRSVRTDLM